jgi:hypothetical protein
MTFGLQQVLVPGSGKSLTLGGLQLVPGSGESL